MTKHIGRRYNLYCIRETRRNRAIRAALHRIFSTLTDAYNGGDYGGLN